MAPKESIMILSAYNLSLDLDHLGLPKGVAKAIGENVVLSYLLQNGFQQAISDAGAVAKDAEIPPTMTREEYIAARRKDRLERILKGDVTKGAGRGPRLVGLEKCIFEATIIRLKAAYAKAARSWPAGKGTAEAERKLVEEYWSVPRKSHAEVRAAAETMFKSQSAQDDLDDLLGDITPPAAA